MRGKLTMQSVHETYVVPALKSNNIAVFTVMWLPIPSLHAVKTWSQKKESDPCVMRQRQLTAVLKCDFGTSSGVGGWESTSGTTRTGSKPWKGRKEARKKGRKKEINCTPILSSSFVPTWVLLMISRSFQ